MSRRVMGRTRLMRPVYHGQHALPVLADHVASPPQRFARTGRAREPRRFAGVGATEVRAHGQGVGATEVRAHGKGVCPGDRSHRGHGGHGAEPRSARFARGARSCARHVRVWRRSFAATRCHAPRLGEARVRSNVGVRSTFPPSGVRSTFPPSGVRSTFPPSCAGHVHVQGTSMCSARPCVAHVRARSTSSECVSCERSEPIDLCSVFPVFSVAIPLGARVAPVRRCALWRSVAIPRGRALWRHRKCQRAPREAPVAAIDRS